MGDHAPYDRAIVTAGAWDIPPAWIDQLSERGRIIVPFRLRGPTRSVVFERDGDRLVSLGYRLCGFVPMQGAGAHGERLILIDGDEVGLRVDEGQSIDSDRLRQALFAPRIERWSEVVFDQPDELELWLGAVPSVLGLLTAKEGPIERGLVAPSAIRGVPTIGYHDHAAIYPRPAYMRLVCLWCRADVLAYTLARGLPDFARHGYRTI